MDGALSFGKYLRNLPAEIDVGEVKVRLREQTDVQRDWRSYGDRIMNRLASEDPRLLLMLDEFPMMAGNIAERDKNELRQFLRWFRAARIAPETRTRFLLAGSINLIHTLDGMGLVDTINDLSEVLVGPFDTGTARRFIQEAMAGNEVELTPQVQERILTLLGTPIPYLLALLLTLLFDRHRMTKAPIATGQVDEVFQQELLGGAGTFFFHYYSRLTQYYPSDQARSAKAILGLMSRSESPIRAQDLYQTHLKSSGDAPGADSEEGFRRLMQMLENDFYVAAKGEGYEFSNRTIRLWWKNHYGAQLQ